MLDRFLSRSIGVFARLRYRTTHLRGRRTGLCGSDKSLILDEWAERGAGMRPASKGIAGHEGAGVVVKVGAGMENRWKIGDRAGIKWIASICGECEFCTNGTDELHCPKQLNSGFTTPGTFQQYCVADGRYTSRIPDGVPDEYAAPILCGGVTAYTACKRSGVRPGQWIVVPGAGGGLGHFAVQYARAMVGCSHDKTAQPGVDNHI